MHLPTARALQDREHYIKSVIASFERILVLSCDLDSRKLFETHWVREREWPENGQSQFPPHAHKQCIREAAKVYSHSKQDPEFDSLDTHAVAHSLHMHTEQAGEGCFRIEVEWRVNVEPRLWTQIILPSTLHPASHSNTICTALPV